VISKLDRRDSTGSGPVPLLAAWSFSTPRLLCSFTMYNNGFNVNQDGDLKFRNVRLNPGKFQIFKLTFEELGCPAFAREPIKYL
jgi:hypothetical protein